MNIKAPAFQPIVASDVAELGTDPIPAEPYYSPNYFELEREAIFKRTWLQMGHVCEVPEPGRFIVREIEIAKASILITHAKDNKIRAFYNVCPHRGTQLVSETGGTKAVFTCPYHKWTFEHDGALKAAPDFEQFHLEKSQCGLKEIAAEVCGGLIFINLQNTPAQVLREFLGPLAEQLEVLPAAQATTFTEYTYELNGNWKIACDNFQENYHLRFIHSRSIGKTAMGPANPFGYPEKFGFYGPHRTQLNWTNPEYFPPQVRLDAMIKLTEYAAAEGFGESEHSNNYFALFPNFFMMGSPILPFSHSIMPIDAGKSRGVIRIYWNGDDDSASKRFAREYAMVMARDIHAEDRPVIEAGQKGLASGALEHIHFQAQESLCRHLFQAVDGYVQAYQAEHSEVGAQ